MADYRYITLATQSVEWTGATGTQFAVTTALVREESDYFGNGDYKPTRDGLRITTSATINGADHPQARGAGVQKLPKPIGAATHCLGQIGFTSEIATQIEAARKLVQAAPEWMAKQAAFDRGCKVERDYAKHVAAVNRMMGE